MHNTSNKMLLRMPKGTAAIWHRIRDGIHQKGIKMSPRVTPAPRRLTARVTAWK